MERESIAPHAAQPAELRLPAVLAARPRPYIMAHRGDSDHAPENTRAAFELAIAAGADILETDLWFTADGHLVCHHDGTLTRMTGDERRIGDVTLAELESLCIRSPLAGRFPGQRVPSLAELLALVPPTIVLALELKDERFAAEDSARALARAAAERIAARTVFFISFARDRLNCLKRIAPDCLTGHITLRNPLPTQSTELLGPYWTLLALNPFYVRMAHRRGRWVCPLDPALDRRLPRYLALGVDAVLTNDPGGTRALIARMRARRT